MSRGQWNKEENKGHEGKKKRRYSVDSYKEKTKGRYRCRDYELTKNVTQVSDKKDNICLSMTTNASESSTDSGEWSKEIRLNFPLKRQGKVTTGKTPDEDE